ncbi:hypothetical protein EXIGLDRAFT_726712 [Exidia glandulosa HHB12029]|uniref:Serine-threonine/tyrosine-protein kinase catalytic domain-containing protein n=1 Tax=Exidia glandulosa HHB12029 TaxID=1314781 RepID=A0A165DKS5_EXIGL|nr:hypothetical protein EXIGLDRAFT_726712 [Exidia glandulosa HHB12029]
MPHSTRSNHRDDSIEPTSANDHDHDRAVAQKGHDTASLTPLGEYLASHPDVDRRQLCQQVAVQLAMYHDVQKVVHGDVKMANVVVNERGVAILPRSSKTVPITSQPRAPTSPEERLPMTTATDLYAFAWLVFHVYTDIDPLVLASDPKTMRLIASGVKPNRPGPDTTPSRRGLNDKIWSVMLKCWDISPVGRPRATEVVQAFDLPATAPPTDQASTVKEVKV